MTSPLNAYRALPRAARWLVVAGAFVLGYFLIVEPVLDAADRVSGEADALAAKLARLRATQTPDSEEGRVLEVGVTNYGLPRLPTDGVRAETLHRLLDEILDSHGVDQRTKAEKQASLRDDRITVFAGPGRRIERLVLDVSFEAEPATVAEIVADLERAPEVAAIPRVRFDRSGVRSEEEGVVRATISAEAWIIVAEQPGRSGGAGGAL